MIKPICVSSIFIFLFFFCQGAQKSDSDPNLIIRDFKPAVDWMTQAYPIGNGRIGAMLFSGTDTDHIHFNDHSLWTGDEKERGTYQSFGDVYIQFDADHASPIEKYERKLDLNTALHSTNYQIHKQTFSRLAFASQPDQVMVFEYTSNNSEGYNALIQLVDAHDTRIIGQGSQLLFSGNLSNNLGYAAGIDITHQGGEIRLITDSKGNRQMKLSGVQSFRIVLAAATNYSNKRANQWRAGDARQSVQSQLKAAANQSTEQLKARHILDYQQLFQRFSVQVGKPYVERYQSTKDRLLAYKKQGDPNLETLILQYGRYLLISSSRKGGLPANLQGLWNNSNNPIWGSDYHSNINIQMNYWPAELSNLAECHIPYLDYIQSMREVKKENTQAEFPGVRGWTVRTENNIFGGESFHWNIPGSAWYMQALWDHYTFNQDKVYLKDFAYPILKEVCEFWDDHLKRRADGTIVAPNGWSPEHGPTEDGVSHDQQIIYDLFTNYMEACDSLQIDPEYRKHIANLREHLLKPQIGRWGQLQEWETDRDDPNNTHRHVSHLFALHPGRQISVHKTPELAEAARVSLTARGDESTGWSMAWKMNFWARLQDGNHAYKILGNFITLVGDEEVDYNEGGGVYENLLCAHPPFQIDGNLGYVAGFAEMLVQSQEGFIDLLPALPDAWKAAGEVKGLKARGNISIDMKWVDGRVTSYQLVSPSVQDVSIKLNGEFQTVKTKKI